MKAEIEQGATGKAGIRGRRRLVAAVFLCSLLVTGMVGEIVEAAIRAPVKADGNVSTYYYVSNDIKDNGDFPVSNIAFYWDASSGSRTITYRGQQCNKGGYDDNSSDTPTVTLTLYGIKTDGSVNMANKIISGTTINNCHGGGAQSFTFNLNSTNYDSLVGLKGVVATIRMVNKGRAFFTLSTDDNAQFGAVDSNSGSIGYSRDYDSAQPGFYNITLNFGRLCSATDGVGYIEFFDADRDEGNIYQSQPLTFRIKNVETGQWLRNNDNRYRYNDREDIERYGGTGATTFEITSGSGGRSVMPFNMAANTRYMLEIRGVSDRNDVAISIPTNEIYGKETCGQFTSQPKIEASVDGGATWQSSNITVSRGDTIQWRHRFSTSGAGNPPTINYGYGDDDTTGTKIVTDNKNAWNYNPSHTSSNGYTDNSSWQVSPSFTVPATASNGTKYCRQTYNTPKSSADVGSAVSSELCATVSVPPLNNELSPYVNTSKSAVSSGDIVDFSYSVHNTGDSAPSNWSVRQITIPSNVAFPADYVNMHFNWSCANYIAAGLLCNDVGTLSGSETFVSNITKTVGTEPVTVSGAIGTRVCRVLVVNPYKDSSGISRDSAVKCVLMAASPYVVVNGGTVWAGGSTDAATGYAGTANIRAAAPSSSFGSFGEYGVFATGTVNYFGSAGRLGKGATTSGMQDGTKLTFANTPSLGKFAAVHKITNLVTYYQDSAHTASVLDAGGVVVASGVYKASGDVTLSGIAGKPKAVLYAPNNTVTIAGNIAYDTSGAVTFKDLPSLTVIAKTIVVNGTVNQIAGNFYAADRFVTCAGGPQTAGASAAITTTGVCSQQLTINGALTVANSTVPGNNNALVLNRSYGGTEPNKPAEIIRMRPEVFLTTYENATSALLLTTVRETELPSRY